MNIDVMPKPSVRSSVYDSVRKILLRLATQIEQPLRIKEEELAKQLGVSRTPVREALLCLSREGVLDFRPQRGAVLLPVTEKQYLEWLQLREELEGFAAREAAMNASQRDVDKLRAIFAPFNDENLDLHSREYAAANVEFHAAVIELAANSLLEKVWRSFGHRDMLGSRTIERLNRARTSLREHLALIDAIELRDASLADRLARQHVHGLSVETKKIISERSLKARPRPVSPSPPLGG